MRPIYFFLIFFIPSFAFAQEADLCPVSKDGGVCLSKENKEEIKKALKELDNIHSSPAVVHVEPIIIIRDWENRVYVNGQDGKPLKMHIKIGDSVDRELHMQLPVQIHYREEPDPPMFRLRIRAQFGLLSTPLMTSILSSGQIQDGIDAGIGWDFFGIHSLKMNVAAYTGARSLGGGVGLDLTKNFGIYGGYSLVYESLLSSAAAQVYFSFN